MESRSLSIQAELDALLPPQIAPKNVLDKQYAPDEIAKTKKTLWSRMKKTLGFLILTYSADTAVVLNTDVEQPTPLPSYSYGTPYHYVSTAAVSGPSVIPSPNEDIQYIIDTLQTDKQYEAFVKEHCGHMLPKTPWTFLNTYAYSPAEFQENGWEGPCNAYAEFACEVGERHGKQMYQLALWPGPSRKDKPSNTLDDYKHNKSWHIVSFYKKRDYRTGVSRFVIFDNSSVVELPEGATLESWASEEGYGIIKPLGGITKWKRPVHDWRAELIGRHAKTTLDEDEIVDTVVGEPIPVIAQN